MKRTLPMNRAPETAPVTGETLRERLQTIAQQALNAWDADRDSRVGKMLAALAGKMPGYRADIDTLHTELDALTRSQREAEQTSLDMAQRHGAVVDERDNLRITTTRLHSQLAEAKQEVATLRAERDELRGHVRTVEKPAFESGYHRGTAEARASLIDQVLQIVEEMTQRRCKSVQTMDILDEMRERLAALRPSPSPET